MKRTFGNYRNVGFRFVTGFLEPGNLPLLEIIDAAQRARGVSGAVAEIGVHHGKLFIPLHLLQRGAGTSVAIDLFGDQELNVDGSGSGDLDKFTANVELWASMDGVAIHQGDSTKLTPEALLAKAGGPIRLFSVDGGHTADIVHRDMQLAEATLADGGIVIADDVFNQQWPGVVVGTLKYLEHAKLAPFAIAFNKTFFAHPGYCDYYRTALATGVTGRVRLQSETNDFAGHTVEYVAAQTAVHLLRRSETLRSAYHGAYRGMVRGLHLVSGKDR